MLNHRGRLAFTLVGGAVVVALLASGALTLGVQAAEEESREERLKRQAEEMRKKVEEMKEEGKEMKRKAAEKLPEDPLAPPAMKRTAPGMVNLLGDAYWYLPYAVINEKQGLAFVEAYKEALLKEEEPPRRLDVPEGHGAGGSGKLYRLQSGVTDMFIRDINNPAASAVSTSEIPVMVAQPKPGESGANVLFMDGHVEFVNWGEFPVTKPFINALAKLDPPEYAEPEQQE